MLNATLDLARGLAALWVFLFHIQGSVTAASPTWGALAAYGHLGVPMFFVISGYCLYASASNSFHPGERNAFLKRRLLRIYPPFWAAILVALASPYVVEALSAIRSGSFALPSPRWLEFEFSEWVQVISLTRVFWNVDGDLQAAFSPINAVFWTLAIEVQFYVVVYLSLLFGDRWRTVLGAIFVISMISLVVPAVRDSGVFLPYWPAFCFGLLLRHLYVVGISPRAAFGEVSVLVSAVAIVLTLGGVWLFLGNSRNSVVWSSGEHILLLFLPFALTVAIALWFLGEIERALVGMGRMSLLRALHYAIQPFVVAGVCSYSLYLIHGRIYTIIEMFVRRLVPFGSYLYPLLTVAGTLLVAYVFYVCVERPFMSVRYQTQVKSGLPRRSLAPSAR